MVQNNSGYRYGDQLSFFRLVQEEDSQDGHPYVTVSATRVNLDPADTSALRDVAPASGFSTVGGTLGADAALEGAGVAWVHSRTVNGKTHVSSHGTTQMLSTATNSYGGTTEIFIRPDGTSGGMTVDEGTGSGTGGGTGEDDGNEGSFG